MSLKIRRIILITLIMAAAAFAPLGVNAVSADDDPTPCGTC